MKKQEVDLEEYNVLTNKKVIVRYIRDNSRYNGKHILAGGMHKDGGKTLTIRRENGLIIPFLSALEFKSLSSHLGDISYTNDSFWKADGRFDVKLINGDIILDLSNPIDYIKWRFLQKYDMLISPNWESRKNMITYKWAFIEDDADGNMALQDMNITAQAYMLFGKYSNDKKTLSYLYWKIESKYVDPTIKIELLKSWFKPIMDNKATLFVRFAEDVLLDEKKTIFLAKQQGIIRQEGSSNVLYYGDKKLTDNPLVGGDDVAAEYISKIPNQPIKMEIMAKLNS
jgi:hypothetical protein